MDIYHDIIYPQENTAVGSVRSGDGGEKDRRKSGAGRESVEKIIDGVVCEGWLSAGRGVTAFIL